MVALARRIDVILHRIWVDGTTFQPDAAPGEDAGDNVGQSLPLAECQGRTLINRPHAPLLAGDRAVREECVSGHFGLAQCI